MKDKNGVSWPENGLEQYIDYNCNFRNLNINLKSEKECGVYFSNWMRRYRNIMKDWSDVDVAIWSIRLRQSLKSTFTSTYFALEANKAKDNGSQAVFYYMSYYSVFHAIWGVMYLHPDEKTDAIGKPTHSKLPNVFQSAFCGSRGIISYPIKEMTETLRSNREYYSYRMPLNSPFNGQQNTWTASVGGVVKQCIQLSNLHSHMICQASQRENRFSASIRLEERAHFINAFRNINSQKNPSNGRWYLEPADETALAEYLNRGCELQGHSIMFEHLSDEFMSYIGNGVTDITNSQEVCSLVYHALC